nr:helix-turn-helix transcriptional regulator [Kosakonia arachidis]
MHILHHAAEKAVFGTGIIDDLQHHGYTFNPDTLYPRLHGVSETHAAQAALRAFRYARPSAGSARSDGYFV